MFNILNYALSKSGSQAEIDLSNYALKSQLNNYVLLSALDAYAKKNEIKAYMPFNQNWRINSTIANFCKDVDEDENAVEGMTFLGELRCSDFYSKGVQISNGEAVVEVIKENGIGGGKTIHIILTSGTTYPYRWEYTYWGHGNNQHGWTGFFPIEDNTITKNALSLDIQNILSDIETIPPDVLKELSLSGSTGSINNLNDLQSMIENNKSEVIITITDDLIPTSSIVIPEGKNVTLDLDGNSIISSGITPIKANGGTLTITNGTVQSNTDALIADNGSTVILDNVNITSSGHNGASLKNGSTMIINSGNITSQEAGVAVFKNSTVEINGGTITGIDNGCIMGNGSIGTSENNGENTHIIMNGGQLIAHIQSAGYVACGIYIPNSGSFTMNGGEVISDGAGLVMRGGKVTLNGGTITANGATGIKGKVGDSRITVGPYAVVYEAESRYPAYETLELIIGSDMVLQGTDGDIDVLLGENMTANIVDYRNI